MRCREGNRASQFIFTSAASTKNSSACECSQAIICLYFPASAMERSRWLGSGVVVPEGQPDKPVGVSHRSTRKMTKAPAGAKDCQVDRHPPPLPYSTA
jgi:hypothetical protein